MPDSSKIKEFPDINNKLSAPNKKSLFERQKAEAEAKRQREQAETAAVYEDFVKSFEDEEGSAPPSGVRDRLGASEAQATSRGGALGGPPKRHFASTPTGPSGRGLGGARGTLSTSGPGSLGPPPSRKRTHDVASRDNNSGLFAFEDAGLGSFDAKAAFPTSDDDDDKGQDEKKAERAAPKPTLHLSSLPPGTSPAVIKSLLPSTLTIDAVRILPPSGPGSSERKSVSSIVTLAKDTPANDIDTAVNGLQNKYLGWGYNLSLSRHLSSAALNAGAPLTAGVGSMLNSMPFGARPVQTGPSGALNRAPPPSSIHRGGFAPPASYAQGQYGRGPPLVQVAVEPPNDLKQLKLIHKTLEAMLTHGPEFEALLMSRPAVQRDGKWAWLWDSRSRGGVWYRWRLWEILSGAQAGSWPSNHTRRIHSEHVFDGGAAWVAPEEKLRFEYSTHMDEFVSDPEYNSSEEEDSGDEERQKHHHNRGGPPPAEPSASGPEADGKAYLNPLKKSKLTHLLARLPTTNARLRKGDVARITAFAIEHAGEGAEEVVDMIVTNIEKPFSSTSANVDRQKGDDVRDRRETDPDVEDKDGEEKEKEDTSPSKLIALYIVSDILSSSSTSGVRHAWRYRQLFEATLKRAKTFEKLGRLDKDMRWGRLRAEKWKRSVGSVLALWEGWCVFPQACQEHFSSVFANPPLSAAEEVALASSTDVPSTSVNVPKSRWKTVEVASPASESPMPFDPYAAPQPEDSSEIDEDVDGEPMEDDDDLDGEPMEDIDGQPVNDEFNGEPMEVEITGQQDDSQTKVPIGEGDTPSVPLEAANSEEQGSAARKRRPRAQDMFADSDED
ncbi:MAG: hypothetical protein M1833_004908 [Piccolia ochrophora]|nr:MAG: hypothetical protein M1833_004908 [Piccolia ochrophora]